jgi:membrane protein
MEKKRFKYFRVLVNQKEDRKQKSFLEKYKDSIGTIASLCAVVAFIVTVITASIQFWNSYQAAEFYHINQSYFIQESVVDIYYDAIAKMFQVFFPIIAFNLIYRKTKEIQTYQNKKCMKKLESIMLHCVFFLVYIIISSKTFSLEAGDYLVMLKIEFVLIVYIVLIIAFVFLIRLSLTSALDVWDKVWCILLSAFFIFLTIKYKQATENIQEFIVGDFSTILFFIYYYVIFMLSKYDEKININFLRFWKVILSIVLSIIMIGPFVMLLQITLGFATGNRYFHIKKYDIVCKIDNDNLEASKIHSELNSVYYDNQQGKKSKFQVVILHRGSQVLLMNGKIDGNETINLQEDMSSSNLVIDTKSYEFQEASQYRFYRKKFNDVTTNTPRNND